MIIGDMEIRLRADIARLQADMDSARRVVGDATASMARAADLAKTALASIGIGAGISEVARMSDEYSKFTAQLRLATDSTRAYNQAYADVKRIANSSQSDLSATGALYATLSRATRDLGASQKSVADITESVNLALKISGAGAQESAGAILQLSQAFAAGALRGDEFNSVSEAAPRLMKALADNIGVPIGALRGMAEQGKLTADLVAKALPQALEQLRSEAGQIQTISGAFTVLKNNVMEFTGAQAQANGTVALLIGGIELLANHLQLLAGIATAGGIVKLGATLGTWSAKIYDTVAANVAARAATVAGMEATAADTTAKVAQISVTQTMIGVAREEAVAKLAGANAGIAAAQAALTAAEAAGTQSFALRTVRLATADLAVAEAERSAILGELAVLGRQQAAVSAQLTEALAAQAAAQAALNGATGAGAVAAGAASRAIGMLGGPIGIIITVLGLAATAWSMWGNSAATSSKQAVETYDEAHKRIVKGLDEQIAKNEKLIQLQTLGLTKQEINRNQPVLDQLAAASQRLNDINNQTGDFAPGKGMDSVDVMQARKKVMQDIVDLTEKMKKGDEVAARAAAGDTEALIAVRERLTGVNQQYLDDLAKLKSALDRGAISQDDYVSAVSKLAKDTYEGSAAGKQYAQSLDAQAESIQRAAEKQGLLNQRQLEHIQFLKSTGQINDETAIKSTADARIKDLNDQIKAQQRLMSVDSQRQESEEQHAQKQAEIRGRIDNLRTQIDNAQKKRDEDLKALAQQREDASRDMAAAGITAATAERDSLLEALNTQLDYNAGIGLTKVQLADVTARHLERAAALKEETAADLDMIEQGNAVSQMYREQAQILRDTAAATRSGAVKQDVYDKNLQDLNAMVDVLAALDDAAQSAAEGMAKSFGSVGEAIGGMTTALTHYERTQAAIAAQLAAATKDAGGDQTKILRANQLAAEASAQAQVKSYGDMASAAKGFFSESSAGYKVLNGIEKVYRAEEMALALETMTKKIFFKETEVAANTTLNATKVAGEAAATAASTGLAATESSAWGITAVVKAIASMPFPLNLAAGAATLAAVVGLGVKLVGSLGGGSVSLSEQRQTVQGTGTVLGDSGAKSDSLSKAVELMASNSSTQINYLAAMTTSLQAIQTNIAGFASQVVKISGITGNTASTDQGSAYAFGSSNLGLSLLTMPVLGPIMNKLTGGFVGKVMGSTLGAIFGGKTTMDDTGFTMNSSSLASLLQNGVGASQYTDITKSGGWFGSDKHSTNLTSLGADANTQFKAIIASLSDSVTEAGKLLGVSGDDFTAKLNSFVVDIGKVSLKGMSGDEIQKALEAVFSKLGDQMAEAAIPDLRQFEQVGEGYLETLVRVASDYAKVDASLQSIGKTFGETGIESIAARESLIALLGGIDDFQSKTASFASNFLTTAQQLVPVAAYVTQSLNSMGLAWVDTREEYAQVVNGLDLTTESGQQTYAALMNLADAFASTHAAIVDATKSSQEIADERKDLQDQFDELTMTQAQLQEKDRAAIDASNLALYDQVQAAKAAAAAIQAHTDAIQASKDAASILLAQVDSSYSVLEQVVNRQKAAIQAQVDQQSAALDALKKTVSAEKTALQTRIDAETAAVSRLQSFSDSIHSTLDAFAVPGTEAAVRQAAQAQIKAALAAVQSGAQLSDNQIAAVKKSFSVVTQDASGQFSTYQDYLRDLYSTKNDVAALGNVVDPQLTAEQASLAVLQSQSTALDALVQTAQDQLDAAQAAAQQQSTSLDGILTAAQQQIDVLKGIDTTGLSIEQALAGLKLSIATAQQNPVVASTSAINTAYQSALGRAPDTAGLSYWQTQAASGMSTSDIVSAITTSPEAKIDQLYETLLGRAPDAAGLRFYLDNYNSGAASMSDIAAAIKSSDEYKARIPGFATGGDFGGGWRIVGENGPELEATGPARYFNASQTQSILFQRLASPQGNSDALAQEVRALREIVSRQQATLDRIANHTGRHADMFDQATGGGGPVLVEIAQ